MNVETGNLASFTKKRKISKFMIDIGLGPSLFLLKLKSLVNLFLILTVMNLPLMWLYYSGEE